MGKIPEDLLEQQLEQIVTKVREALWLEDGEWNPEKEWSGDELDQIGAVFQEYELVPEFTTEQKLQRLRDAVALAGPQSYGHPENHVLECASCKYRWDDPAAKRLTPVREQHQVNCVWIDTLKPALEE